MKLNINWKELGIQLLKAIWPVLAGALTGATVVTATGCTSMATQPRGQTTEIILCVMRFDCVINQLVSSALNWEASGIVFRQNGRASLDEAAAAVSSKPPYRESAFPRR